MKRMRNRRDSLARRIEKLPINTVKQDLAQANFAAAEAAVDHIARAVTWVRSFVAPTSAVITPPRP
jgi:phage-related minor tail protein